MSKNLFFINFLFYRGVKLCLNFFNSKNVEADNVISFEKRIKLLNNSKNYLRTLKENKIKLIMDKNLNFKIEKYEIKLKELTCSCSKTNYNQPCIHLIACLFYYYNLKNVNVNLKIITYEDLFKFFLKNELKFNDLILNACSVTPTSIEFLKKYQHMFN